MEQQNRFAMAGLGHVHAQCREIDEAMPGSLERGKRGLRLAVPCAAVRRGRSAIGVGSVCHDFKPYYVYSSYVTTLIVSGVTPTKARALDAAIDLVGTEGLRALTHARVDERSGLPRGSTSNYFRTRAALLCGVADWLAEREMPGVSAAFSPASAADLVDALCGLLQYTTGANRTLTTARLILFMEASHDPALRTALSRGRAAMESSVADALARLGAPDPQTAANAVMACAEGLILHRIARGDGTDPRPTIDLVVRAALG